MVYDNNAGNLIFALLIDRRRMKRRNERHTRNVDPRIKSGKDGSDWNCGDGPARF